MRFLVILAYVLATLTTTAFFVTDARAVNLSWNAAGGGNADTAANWTPSQIPGLADDLTFGLGNTYNVSWDDTISNVDTIDVSAGNVTFDDLGNTDLTTTGLFEVGDNSGGMATLALDGGMWTAGNSVRIGFNPADDGRLEVLGDASFNAPSIAVGFRGDGELILTEGSITATGSLNAASATGGSTNGTALIEVGDTFNVTGNTNLGASAGGTATLRVNGGDYTSGGATTINAGSLLEVLSGTYNANSSLTLASATSTLTLNGGSLNANAGLNNSAAGTLNLSNSTLTVTGGAFQPNAGGPTDDYLVGSGLVLGAGATANIGRHLTVNTGNNVLTIQNGGTISNVNATIGSLSGLAGFVTVDGTGSTWTNTGTLTVGDEGSAALTIQNGENVSSLNGEIASSFTASSSNPFSSTATVDGAGSTWTSGTLLVGEVYFGSLNIQNGGTVSSGVGSIGVGTTATNPPAISGGAATVDGAGSTLAISGSLSIGGGGGDGDLRIQNGGMVSSQTGSIGGFSSFTNDGGSGTVTVDGTGSTWTNTGDFDIGGSGPTSEPGLLTVQNNGLVEVGGTFKIWTDGTVNLNGGTLKVDSTAVVVDGTLNFVTGSFHLTDTPGYTVGANSGPIDQLLGGSHVRLFDGNGLIVENTLTVPVATSLTVTRSSVDANTLINNDLVISTNSTLTTTTELTNNADMVLIDSTVEGPMNNTVGSTVTVVGIVDFNGLVTGPGNFFGPGTANFNGGMAPGASPAEVSFEGGVALGSTNTLFVELGGLTAGTEFDLLDIAGAATLGGTLDVQLINGFAPSAGNSFDILTASGSIDNAFATVNLPSLSSGLAWNVNQGANLLSLAVGLAGDYNGDGTVDAADYTVWRDNEGAPAGTLPNDADGGVIGAAQYNSWVANFGATASLSASVPEPSGLALLACIAAQLTSWRKRAYVNQGL